LQAYAPFRHFDGIASGVGAWIIGQECAEIGLREDRTRITQDLSRFNLIYHCAVSRLASSLIRPAKYSRKQINHDKTRQNASPSRIIGATPFTLAGCRDERF